MDRMVRELRDAFKKVLKTPYKDDTRVWAKSTQYEEGLDLWVILKNYDGIEYMNDMGMEEVIEAAYGLLGLEPDKVESGKMDYKLEGMPEDCPIEIKVEADDKMSDVSYIWVRIKGGELK